jgi:alkylation response protein AidB-like acyl-CoA dehydrogenase
MLASDIRSVSYADARVQKIYGGTNEILKELVDRDL